MGIPPEIMQQLQQQTQQLFPMTAGPSSIMPGALGGPGPVSQAAGGWLNPPGVPGALPGGMPGVPPSVTPVSIRTSLTPGAAAPSPLPNVAQLLQPNIAGRGTPVAAASTGNILQRALGKIPGANLKIPGGGAGRIGASLGLGMVGNFLGDKAGGDDSVLGRFLKGAGAGGGLGILGGPQAGILGGLIGGVGNAIFGGGDDEGGNFEDKLDTILTSGGFSDEDATQIKLMYSVLKETSDEETAKTTIGTIITQDMQMREQAQLMEEQAQAKMLATQALTAQFFQPFTQQLLDSAQQRYSLTESLAEQLPPEVRNIARANNVATFDNATRVANAYAAQAQMMPMMAGMQMQQGLADQLAQQQAQTVIANLFGGGGGGGSLTDLLSQQALAGQNG